MDLCETRKKEGENRVNERDLKTRSRFPACSNRDPRSKQVVE